MSSKEIINKSKSKVKFMIRAWRDFFEELGLECLSPCFDADVEYCVFGVKVLNVDYTYKRVPYDITRLINEANKEFRSLTGMDGEVYFGPDVW